MTTAALVASSVLTRAADEDDAIEAALPAAERIAATIAQHMQDAADDPGVSGEQADAFRDAMLDDIRLAIVEAAQPVLVGVVERAHGGISTAEARRLERVTRKAIDDHRAIRRAARPSDERKSEPPQ